MSDETALLPCPFCGGEAQTTLRNIGDSGEDFWSIECFDPECGCDFCLYTTESEAIEAWNTRAELTCEMEWVSDWMGWHCKACDNLRQGLPDQKPNYCPNCGAKAVDA